MKTIPILSGCIFFLLVACNHSKKSSSSTDISKETSPGISTDLSKLEGDWVLNYIHGSTIPFDSLFPAQKPDIFFSLTVGTLGGFAGCNSFRGLINVDGNKINFNDEFEMSQMTCPGSGEKIFLETLKKVNTWSVIDHKTLNFMTGDSTVMKFAKQ